MLSRSCPRYVVSRKCRRGVISLSSDGQTDRQTDRRCTPVEYIGTPDSVLAAGRLRSSGDPEDIAGEVSPVHVCLLGNPQFRLL